MNEYVPFSRDIDPIRSEDESTNYNLPMLVVTAAAYYRPGLNENVQTWRNRD